MRIIETKVYTIDEHPSKSLCFDWMRDNCPELNDHGLQEMRESIAALSECIGGTHDYQFGVEPSNSQFISFMDYDIDKLMALDADDCSLTGNNYDYSVIKAMQDLNANVKGHNLIFNRAADEVFSDLHTETEYIYSDEGLFEWAEMGELEFTEDGKAL